MRKPIEILLVEDNPGDVALLRMHLKDAFVPHHLHVVVTGEQAMTWLREPGPQTPRPQLILLDLNLPGKSGLEVLRELKDHSDWGAIPILIFTSSDSADDVDDCYRQQANAYICKPSDIEGYRRVADAIKAFWLGTAKLPAA